MATVLKFNQQPIFQTTDPKAGSEYIKALTQEQQMYVDACINKGAFAIMEQGKLYPGCDMQEMDLICMDSDRDLYMLAGVMLWVTDPEDAHDTRLLVSISYVKAYNTKNGKQLGASIAQLLQDKTMQEQADAILQQLAVVQE